MILTLIKYLLSLIIKISPTLIIIRLQSCGYNKEHYLDRFKLPNLDNYNLPIDYG